MSTAWTDELKKEVVDAYLALEPTPENSMDIVKKLAEDYEKTPNGIRMILTKADAYIKKAAAAPAAKKEGAATSTRVNKKDAQDALADAITGKGAEVDLEIIEKLTGKAAVYLLSVLTFEA
tara:strand:+ start:312 stop:674 length:363 start_codon:yes stop_codon:yes gene_type:complete